MKILSAEEIRLWDQYTMLHEPVSSINLMERAAAKCADWLEESRFTENNFVIFCGKGNNGGDGLALARLLAVKKYQVTVCILELGQKGTDDFHTNLERLQKKYSSQFNLKLIKSTEDFPPFQRNDIIVDALFGSGLNRSLEGVTAKLVEHINDSGLTIVSIDIPSGLFTDRSSKGNTIVNATHTLSFQCYKPAFLFPENEEAVGQVHILDIGLHPGFNSEFHGQYELVDDELVHSIYKPRNRFSHKGHFGHALLVAGSYGKIGAAVLSARACLRSGTGLLTCHIPQCAYDILQSTVPEAMAQTDRNALFNTKITDDITHYDAIGIGPGLGTTIETKMLLRDIFDRYRSPMVLDADALNILAAQKDLLDMVPSGSILTPHPKEFERLFGESSNDFERVLLAMQKARELDCIIVLKGHHTFIATTDGKARPDNITGPAFFNTTGNAGMATAGSGDVLTGILTGLVSQGYSSVEAAILGVYLHGRAGDLAAKKISMEAMIAGDIIDNLGQSFLAIQ